MTKEKYEFLTGSNEPEEVEIQTCEEILQILNFREQLEAAKANLGDKDAYWMALFLKHKAIPYVEDWKNSI